MKQDWLNNFIEKNAWGILVALIGVVIAYTLQNAKVQAQEEKIKSIEEAQIVIVENQRNILELQVNQKFLVEDVTEIKGDVKIILEKVK